MSDLKPRLIVKDIPCVDEGYWEYPSFSDKGDPNIDLVYTAVGKALSEWEKLEQRLANLFLVVCATPENSANPVRRAFGAIESGTLRRSAVIAAAKVHFGKRWDIGIVAKSFNKIIQAISFASHIRDDIAHGIADHIKDQGVDYGAFLFPPYYNTGRTSPYYEGEGPHHFIRSEYRFTSADLKEFTKHFGELKLLLRECANLCARFPDEQDSVR